jgi:hypothetical protein
MRRFAWFGLLVGLLPLLVLAHKPSDSYLTLDLDGTTVAGRWDIALRDLDHALGLDRDGDDAITWGELQTRHGAIAEYALARLRLTGEGRNCGLNADRQWVVNHSDGAYTVLYWTSDCRADELRQLDYRLFADLDPTHRGLVQLRYPDGVQTAILGGDQPLLALEPGGRGNWSQFAEYWREGVWHIWIGFDHILFLLALLLPSVLWWQDGCWQRAASLGRVARDVVAVVTAFTVAHSITLSAAVLGWVVLPARLVESAIAATVIFAALNNLFPMVRARRWLLAFGLGLIHGFGFAGVLIDLGLPADALALALAGFNLGVEFGQLVIVFLFVPLAYALRGSWFYRRACLQFGSLAVASMALLWLLERSLLPASTL